MINEDYQKNKNKNKTPRGKAPNFLFPSKQKGPHFVFSLATYSIFLKLLILFFF